MFSWTMKLSRKSNCEKQKSQKSINTSTFIISIQTLSTLRPKQQIISPKDIYSTLVLYSVGLLSIDYKSVVDVS